MILFDNVLDAMVPVIETARKGVAASGLVDLSRRIISSSAVREKIATCPFVVAEEVAEAKEEHAKLPNSECYC
jgi:hypothetical protein